MVSTAHIASYKMGVKEYLLGGKNKNNRKWKWKEEQKKSSNEGVCSCSLDI